MILGSFGLHRLTYVRALHEMSVQSTYLDKKCDDCYTLRATVTLSILRPFGLPLVLCLVSQPLDGHVNQIPLPTHQENIPVYTREETQSFHLHIVSMTRKQEVQCE